MKWVTATRLVVAERAALALRAALYRARGKPAPNPYRLYEIPPTAIEYFQTGDPDDPVFTGYGGAFDKFAPGRVVDGDWDLQVTPVTKTALYRGLHERFIQGKPWDETILHPDRLTEDHPNIGRRYRSRSPEKFLQASASRDRLYESMMKHGYLPQRAFDGSFWDELTINIGRDGRLIRNSSGQHRLIIARLLHLPTLLARVLVVHARWTGEFAYRVALPAARHDHDGFSLTRTARGRPP